MHKIVFLLITGIFVAGMLAAGCSAPPSQNTGASGSTVPAATISLTGPALKDTVWQLVSYAGTDSVPVPVQNATGATAIFKGNNEFESYIGCNRYAAPYTLDESSLTLGPLVSTGLACAYPAGLEEQEKRFLSLLPRAKSIGVMNGQLELKDATGNTLLVFSPALGTSPLPKTAWMLQSYLSAQGSPITVIDGTEVSAEFGSDGRLTGFGGCNRYSTNYLVNGSTLATGEISATTLTCTIPFSTNAQETRIFALFPMASHYTISGNQLILQEADGQVLMIFGMR
jgi:heat shock protein HslJ